MSAITLPLRRPKATAPLGYVLYEGPSQLDGSPIVMIATGFNKASRNAKTGDMIQTWIMRADMPPTEAIQTGADAAICGDCPHRGRLEDGRNVGRSCYVTVHQAPLQVWKAWQAGRYPKVDYYPSAELFRDRVVRLGSYGDPAAVPLARLAVCTIYAKAWTGYTHQWRDCPTGYAAYVMASCDSIGDRNLAKSMGYRTFRVTGGDPVAERFKREVICPASAEAGFKTNCAACRACGGLGAKAKADIVIAIHGSAGKVKAFLDNVQ